MGRPPVLLCVLTGSLVFVVDLAAGACGQHICFQMMVLQLFNSINQTSILLIQVKYLHPEGKLSP